MVDCINNICFIDVEITKHSNRIHNLAGLCGENKITTSSILELKQFIYQNKKIEFICGHNFFNHDYGILYNSSLQSTLDNLPIIDTLFCSILIFPYITIHKLSKPYKYDYNIEESLYNDPLADCQETKRLLSYFIESLNILPKEIIAVLYNLVKDDNRFNALFKFISYQNDLNSNACIILIANLLGIEQHIEQLNDLYISNKIELSLAISFLYNKKGSLAPYILKNFPNIVGIIHQLNELSTPLSIEKFADVEFGISSFRSFSRLNTNMFVDNLISQYDIVKTSLTNQSLLVVLPTGGGKTFTFQLPALIKAQMYKGLTVVISPLQALMKNHVDNFKSSNYQAVAISGYLSPVEKLEAINLVFSGSADILYLAPEALRSNNIIKALKSRIIERFVIDEAHCFSAWGHDFRHDYNYISDIIKELQEQNFQPVIPVSCFTATAKPEVLRDIRNYFYSNLNLELQDYIAQSERENLTYRIIRVNNQDEKYQKLIEELEQLQGKSIIIYRPQNARGCKELAEQLQQDPRINDFVIEPFYSRIDDEITENKREGRTKAQILNDFIENKVNIVIATTAFGMGIDKPDIEAVIHYEPSDSIEAYMQESGRGARSTDLSAECIIFYLNNDFDRIFTQLNRTKLDFIEIKRVVSAFKKQKHDNFYITSQQIAEHMGLDIENSNLDYVTIIKTAILELEKSQIINRGRDKTLVYGTSIPSFNNKLKMEYIHEQLEAEKDKNKHDLMIRIMQNIIQRSKIEPIEISQLSYIMGSNTSSVFQAIHSLQEKGLIDYDNDMAIYVHNNITQELEQHFAFEDEIWNLLINSSCGVFNLRELNTKRKNNRIKEAKKIIQSWRRLYSFRNKDKLSIRLNHDMCRFEISMDIQHKIKLLIDARQNICYSVVAELSKLLNNQRDAEIEISINLLFHKQDKKISLEGFHFCLVYLHNVLNSFKLGKGRLIYYHSFKIKKLSKLNQHTPYKVDDYNTNLSPYYERKIEAIHILIQLFEIITNSGWREAKQFIADYFYYESKEFKRKYKLANTYLPMTKQQQQKILHDVNDEQKSIIENNRSQAILVLAGPGSGKTKTLVHKIATLITKDQEKPEYFLMLTHSRVAVMEFRERLERLIGKIVYNMEIMTFHSFAVKIVGQVINNNQDMQHVIDLARTMLDDGYLLPLKTILVLDEYQDVSQRSYNFIQSIYKSMSKINKDCKIIAVGDDDQCINNFPYPDGASISFMQQFTNDFGSTLELEEEQTKKISRHFIQYSLSKNYRSLANLVDFSSCFATKYLSDRLKTKPLIAQTNNNGSINIYRYTQSNGLINEAIEYVIANNITNCALLFRTNEEVLIAYSFFQQREIKARYLVEQNSFKLGQLQELQEFLYLWQDEKDYDRANEMFEQYFSTSANYNLAKEVIHKFRQQILNLDYDYDSNYLSELFADYLDEIEFDEFDRNNRGIIVATMHKAKGKEFSQVVLVLNNEQPLNQFGLRLIYVGLTRAKEHLTVFTNNGIFDDMKSLCSQFNYCEISSDTNQYKIILVMGLKDIQLSNSYAKKGIEQIKPLAGEKLIIQFENNFFRIKKNQVVVAQLSKSFSNKISERLHAGYVLQSECVVDYIVAWWDDNVRYYQVLCKISLLKSEMY